MEAGEDHLLCVTDLQSTAAHMEDNKGFQIYHSLI